MVKRVDDDNVIKFKKATQENLENGDRMLRIRSSLQKINRLMAELKEMAKPTPEEKEKFHLLKGGIED